MTNRQIYILPVVILAYPFFAISYMFSFSIKGLKQNHQDFIRAFNKVS